MGLPQVLTKQPQLELSVSACLAEERSSLSSQQERLKECSLAVPERK